MIKKYFIFFILFFIISCDGNNDKSDAYGVFEADETTISAEATGKILELNIDEGQNLYKNFLAGIIDTADLVLKKEEIIANKKLIESKFDEILSNINIFEQQKKNFIVEKNRLEKMFKDDAATQKQLDDINGKIDLIDKQIESVNTQKNSVACQIQIIDEKIKQIKRNIKKCYIYNPVKGCVLSKYINKNEIVTIGRPIYKISDLKKMTLKVYVSGAQMANIKIGQKAEVFVDKNKNENRKLSGIVSWISPKAEFTPKIIQTKEERVNMVYAVKLIVNNDGYLKIGMPAEVNFIKK